MNDGWRIVHLGTSVNIRLAVMDAGGNLQSDVQIPEITLLRADAAAYAELGAMVEAGRGALQAQLDASDGDVSLDLGAAGFVTK